MIFTITISISTLVIINLVLLKFSSYKNKQQTKTIKTKEVITHKITIEPDQQELAPTGS